MKTHHYSLIVRWTGNTGAGTSDYRSYARSHVIDSDTGKPPILGSADPQFRGDPGRWNPEELLVASLSTCHELWYLHLCADAGIVVVDYVDRPEAIMEEREDGSGRFVRAVLRPQVTIAPDGDVARATALHDAAHRMCFVANSVNFPVEHEPRVDVRVPAARPEP